LEDFKQRNTEFEDKKRRKIQEKLDEEKDKELEGCTFKPEINHYEGDSRRSLN